MSAQPDFLTDEELDQKLLAFFRAHLRTLIKAPMIAAMAGFSAMIVSGSIYKAVTVGTVCLLLSGMNTWRRYLEPLTFWCFAATVIYWCDPEVVNHIKTAARSVLGTT